MLPLRRRVELFFAGPFLAATWHSETWTMNRDIANQLTIWVRYKLGQMTGIHLRSDSEAAVHEWWKNIHRAGKVALHVCKKDPVREVFNNQWRFAGHLSRLGGPFVPQLLRKMDSYRWEFVQPMDPVGSANHHEGRLNVNRWDQHLTRAFPIRLDDLKVHYGVDPDSPDKGSLLPTGWHLLAPNQTGWKQLRDETVTLMINNLQLDLRNKPDEINNSLKSLHDAGYMSNLSLSSIADEVLDLPVVGVELSQDVQHDLFEPDPQIEAEDNVAVTLPVPSDEPASGIGRIFGRSFANLVGCVVVVDVD